VNGTPPIVQTEHVDEHMATVYISFTVLARYVDFVLDLSYFKLRQLEMGEATVIQTTERLCRAHQDVVIYIYI
jgi:hypothetical protein